MSAAIRVGFNARGLADARMRGLTRYTVGLLRALSANDDVELVLFSSEDLAPVHLEGIRARVVTFSARRETLWNDDALPRMIRREGVSVFHAPADRGLPFRKSCPCVVTIHGWYEREQWRALFPSLKERCWYWKHEWINDHRANAVITVSETAREHLRRRGVKDERLHVTPLAAGPEFTSIASIADQAVLRAHRIDGPYVLYVGGYDRHKNVETLVQAFETADLPDHRLVIAAEHQWRYAELASDWRALRCHGRLRLIEAATDEVPALYRHAAMFVNPARAESFGLQLVEAMASGIPLLAAERGALPEVAGDAALYFDPDHVKGLADAMTNVAGDPALRATLRAKGVARARAFSWSRTADATMAVYRAVLARGHERPARSLATSSGTA
jgi:glycosyltransferase involved in cell wall biosynthesis